MTPPLDNSVLQKFCKIWIDSFVLVITQLGVAAVKGSCSELVESPLPTPEEIAKTISVPFTGGGILTGGMIWMAERATAVQLAQLLLSELTDPAAEFTATHADAYSEFVRQVAGHAASAWKRETGGESELSFQESAPLGTSPGQTTTVILEDDKLSSISLRLFLSGEMTAGLANWKPEPEVVAPEPPPPPPPAKAPAPAAPPAAEKFVPPAAPVSAPAASVLPPNLDLLLDVELEATIRFGERTMLLRDVFGLMPGAVVELNQQVNEPAELLVAGRLIAKGEVVIVDGNFGLRVTNVISARQRAELLQL